MPHNFLFIFFNAIYALPVIYVYFFGFSEGGVETKVGLTPAVLGQMLEFYFIMAFSFFLGSCLPRCFIKIDRRVSIFNADVRYRISRSQDLLFLLVAVLHVLLKIQLYREGVYDSYAFDSGGMSSKAWNVSMGVSELLLSLCVFFLFSGNKRRAFFAFFLVSLNLLHGTRILFLILLFVLFVYFVYFKRSIGGVRLLLTLFASSLVVMLAFLAVFFARSGVNFNWGDLSFDVLISPVVYESLFNQISFIRVIEYWKDVPFAAHQLFSDSVLFSLPNLSSSGKSELMYVSEFGRLSPLGGLSGYASAYIYFSWLYFAWYMFLGFFMSALLYLSRVYRSSVFLRFFYVYFLCDIFFRLHRDPFYIAIKIMWNNLFFILVFMSLPFFVKFFVRPFKKVGYDY